MGSYNCLLKLKGHHWGNLVIITVPRLVGAARTRACGATVGGGRIVPQQPDMAAAPAWLHVGRYVPREPRPAEFNLVW